MYIFFYAPKKHATRAQDRNSLSSSALVLSSQSPSVVVIAAMAAEKYTWHATG